MIGRTTLIAGTFALGAVAGVANAQIESRPRTGAMVAAPRTPPAGGAVKKARIAFIPPSPPAATPTVFQQSGQLATFLPPIAPSPTAQVSRLFFLPTVGLSDGRIFADFGTGRGYEQVLRRCAAINGPIPPGFATAACWAVDPNGRYIVIQQR
jgi:hypothetical protein